LNYFYALAGKLTNFVSDFKHLICFKVQSQGRRHGENCGEQSSHSSQKSFL